MKYIKQIKRETVYKISFIDKKGYPFLKLRFIRKKEVLIALIMSLLLIIFLSNIIWEVKITGVPKEIGRASCRESVDVGGGRRIEKNTREKSRKEKNQKTQKYCIS